jgi:uncharacterized protein YabN with tetrapyrrole methylase and pyrophosphatase domain
MLGGEMIGTLTVVGTGLHAANQITPEAINAMHRADCVYHCTSDPGALAVIQQVNHNCHDLRTFYDETLPRFVTYERMTNAIVDAVRKGLNVCAVYYGHPGVCATAPHIAVERVRTLGGLARILPAISSHDALLASCGIDPGMSGCQIFEATDYVTRAQLPDVWTPLIVYQAAMLGDVHYYRSEWPNVCATILRDRLSEHYGPTYQCMLYTAASGQGESERVEIWRVDQLGREARLRVAHTLLIPAQHEAPRDAQTVARIHRVRDQFYRHNGKRAPEEWDAWRGPFNRSA